MAKEYIRRRIRIARLPDWSGGLLCNSLSQAGIAYLFIMGCKEIQNLSTVLAEYHVDLEGDNG